jgi:ketosteroid isomerase-like protein
MPRGPTFATRATYRRRRIAALVALGAIVAAVVVLLTRGGGGPGEPPIPTLAFQASVTPVLQGKQPDQAAATAEGEALTKIFNDFYQTAFVDPRRWGDGTFPDLIALFAEDARPAARKDIASLTIGEARTELRRVEPMASTLGLTIYYDAEARPTFAVALASFSARGTPKRAGPPLAIRQRATFYLQKTGDAWRITAFDAQQEQVSETASPSPGATGRAT